MIAHGDGYTGNPRVCTRCNGNGIEQRRSDTVASCHRCHGTGAEPFYQSAQSADTIVIKQETYDFLRGAKPPKKAPRPINRAKRKAKRKQARAARRKNR
jgi:hypothetical protein